MWIYVEPATRFFTPPEKQQLEAVFEAIFPGDESTPGARDADAAEYVNRLLAMPPETYYEIPAWQSLYKSGLPALEGAAVGLFGQALVALTVSQMTALLSGLQTGSLAKFTPQTPVDQKTLFSVLRSHCIEGCFADARWGGNKNQLIWRWYGYVAPAENFRRG